MSLLPAAEIVLAQSPTSLCCYITIVAFLLYVAGFAHHKCNLRHTSLWIAFTLAMFGVCYSSNWFVFVFFWELLSVLSFFLVGHPNAYSALVINVAGGAALVLAGLAGSEYQGLLILIGVLTKSAQWPFHRWIYQVAVAPTHVSAFLHAATLVQSGLILLSRLQIVDPLLDIGLRTSAVLTAAQCLFQREGKALIVCSTQVFVATMLWRYTLYHAPLWDHIMLHMTYKPALFFTTHTTMPGTWWLVGLMHAAMIITNNVTYYTIPYIVAGWKVFAQVYRTPIAPKSYLRDLLACWLGCNPLVSCLAALGVVLSADLLVRHVPILMLAFLTTTKYYDCLLIIIALLLSLINIPAISIQLPRFLAYDLWRTRIARLCDMVLQFACGSASMFAIVVAVICIAWPCLCAWWQCMVFAMACLALNYLARDRLGAVGVFVLAGWCGTTLLGLLAADDVMMTQVSVDALIAIYVIQDALRNHPAPSNNTALRNPLIFAISVLFGCAIYSRLGYVQTYPIPDFTHHLVNTVVSDRRALDTLGEICVFSIAGLAIARHFGASTEVVANFDSGRGIVAPNREFADRFWGFVPFCTLLYTIAVSFMFRSECYGSALAGFAIAALFGCARRGFLHAPPLAALMLANTTGHSGGFAAGVVLGILAAMQGIGLGRAPYGLLAISTIGLAMQWQLYGMHGYWSSAWWFELGILCVVAWVVRVIFVSAGQIGAKSPHFKQLGPTNTTTKPYIHTYA